MAFLPLIPEATDALSISQGNILNNFTILGAIAGNSNSSSASINSNSGFNWIFLPSQGTAPGDTPPSAAAFPAGTIGLYSAINPVTGQNDLYINKTNQTTVVQVAAASSVLSTTSAPLALSSGWTYLPSGILLKWGSNISANGSTTIAFPAASNIPAFNTCFTVFLTIQNSSGGDSNTAVRLVSVAPTTFDVYGSLRITLGATPITFSYVAIGY
jgi:hypothetical protein